MAEPAGALAAVRGFPTPAGPVDLDVHAGDVVHLHGGNGSGKTSLLRALAGLPAPVRPNSATLGGLDPARLGAPELARRVRALWSSPRAGLVGLTVGGEARLRGVALPGDLGPLAHRDIATLSSGEARKVSLALLAASPAPLLLLDEPCGHLDDEGLRTLDGLVGAARLRGAVAVADHTGWAARHANRTVDLGGHADAAPPPMPRLDGDPVLRAIRATARRSGHDVRLPALELGPGLHAVTGRNGAGKTTLLRRLAGLEDTQGVAVAGRAPEPGQDVRLLLSDAGELLMAETVAAELGAAADPEGLVPNALRPRHPMALSAGEGQRVGLAKALGRDAPVHLLDEPEAHLDADGRARLMQAIARRLAAGSCIVVATHDPALVAAARTRIEVDA